jgi:hypothetical protein
MPDETRNQSFRPVLQFSRLPGAQHPAQDQADVECAEMNRQALENILPSLKGAASHSAALITMSKGWFDLVGSANSLRRLSKLLPYSRRTC